MQLCHEPAPLRKARQIDSEKRSILTELATRRCGKDLLQAESMGWAPPPPPKATRPMLRSSTPFQQPCCGLIRRDGTPLPFVPPLPKEFA